MKRSIKRHIGNLLLTLLPSSLYKQKITILKFMDVEIDGEIKLNVGCKFYGEGAVKIHTGTWIGPNCKFYTAGIAGITIEENCDIAPDVSFICGSHEVSNENRRAGKGICKNIIIRRGSWIGASTLILQCEIGAGVIVGAGAIVNKSIPPNVLAVGSPAKVVKDL